MSYAKAAAQGANQSDKDARAPQPPQVKVGDTETSTSSLVDVDSPHVATVPPDFESQEIKTSTQAERVDREDEEKQEIKEAKARAKAAAGRGKAKASGACDKLNRNKSNPVVVGNAILLTAAGAGLAYGAYHKHLRGVLTWELVARWASGIGAVGLFDYYVSRWFFQNKYPPK